MFREQKKINKLHLNILYIDQCIDVLSPTFVSIFYVAIKTYM